MILKNDMGINIGIVAIAYNRPNSLARLLASLNKAEYFNDSVDLIISIDYSGLEDVYQLADKFEWLHGKKIIIKHKEKLGLRNHVLFCGNLTKEYTNICVFEDDIFVSPGFYNFTKQALKQYEGNDDIAGISLYTHMWNYIANRPFNDASVDEHDVFLMQQAQSWGQVWSKSKWDSFMIWYNDNSEKNLEDVDFPAVISNWPNSSWLKYHMKYLTETNKYFIYPKKSFATNFSDIGTHAMNISYCYQVVLEVNHSKVYSFPSEIKYVYDVFFENEYLFKSLDIKQEELTIDLYSQKQVSNKYLLTSKILNYKIIKSFGLNLRPHDLNVIFNIHGTNIFLYDTQIEIINPYEKKQHLLNEMLYDVKTNSKKKLLKLAVSYYYNALKFKINQFF